MKKKAVALCMVLMACMLCLAGCGKKSEPLPQKIDQLFSWRNVFVNMSPDGAIGVHGSVAGAAQNVQAIVLELEPLDEACGGCPFVPLEIFPATMTSIWEAPGSPNFSFSVRPATRASAFRWRLVGHNVVSGLPETVSPVRVISNEPVEREAR